MQAIQNFIESMRSERSRDSNIRAFLLTLFWVTVAFVFVMVAAPRAEALESCYTGSWYDPANPGEGISVEVLDDTVLVYFYRSGGAWFVLQGDDDGLEAYQPWLSSITHVGSGAFVPTSENTALFAYDLLLDLDQASFAYPTPWCLRVDCADAKDLERLTQPIPCE